MTYGHMEVTVGDNGEVVLRVELAHAEELRRASNAHAARLRTEDIRFAGELADIELRHEASRAAITEPDEP